MSGRFAYFAFALAAGLAFGCSSSNTNTSNGSDPAGDDTGAVVEEDTAPAEDTAPWNTYPEGPYGLAKKGQVFPNVALQGYRDGTGEWTEIKMIDYYDPTGERGIYAVLVVVSAEWCGPCNEEAKDLPGFYESLYKPRGAKFLSTMIEQAKKDSSGRFLDADQATVDRWQKKYHLTFSVAADPGHDTIPASAGLPRNYIINPRNMQIMRINEGVNPDAEIIPGLNPFLDYMGAPKLADAG